MTNPFILQSLTRRIQHLENRIEYLETAEPQIKHLAWERYFRLNMMMPGLRGYWPASGESGNADLRDYSGNDKMMQAQSSPKANILNDYISYVECDGSGDYFASADGDNEAHSITAAEANVDDAVDGLSFGGWFKINSGLTSYQTFLGKYYVGATSYIIYHDQNANIEFGIYDGSTLTEWDTGFDATTGSWQFHAAQFDPGNELRYFLNGTWADTPTSLTSIQDNTSRFEIFANNGGSNTLHGAGAQFFLSARILSRSYIEEMWNMGRLLFEV